MEIATGLKTQIENEIRDYFDGVVNISEDYNFSQPKLVRRISLFENHIYPTGKFDSRGNYKFWYDIITPRIDAEVKNIDFDTKNIEIYSERKIDALATVVSNLKLREWLRENGEAEEINSAVEEGASWGNVVWKKIKGGYERVDLKNFYVINQTASNLSQSPTIERYQYSQSDLRAKIGVWDNVQETIDECDSNYYAPTAETQGKETTTPFYEIFERNGEVKLSDLKKSKGKEVKEADENEFVLAKVIVSAKKSSVSSNVEIKYILYADEIKEMPFEEYHRSRYKGRWFREGLTELLFDCQVRANQIGNQIAQGLEWASKTIFTSADKLIVQNILSDLNNGDIIRTQGINQVNVRMEGFDQLAAEWNRIIQLANDIANSREIVQGESLPSGMPFRLGSLLNINANKLFDFIREKLAIPLTTVFERWIVPELIKDLKAQDVIRLTGDSQMLDRIYQMIIDDWYLNNLLTIGPHGQEIADTLKAQKLEELKSQPELLMTGLQKVFEGFKPNVSVIITGENSRLPEDLQTLGTFIQMEADPVRRQALIEIALRKKGIDAGALPKTEPNVLAGQKSDMTKVALSAGELNQ